MNFNEILYIIQNKPYFKVYVKSHGRIIKSFVQLAGGNGDSAESFFLICKDLKCTWWKPFTPVVDGLKFITYADLANAIPLKFSKETKYESTDLMIYEIEETTIVEDTDKQSKFKKVHDGLPEKLVEISYPPAQLFEVVEAHFVTKILTPPPDKFDFLKNKWLLIAIAGLVIWWVISGGHILGS